MRRTDREHNRRVARAIGVVHLGIPSRDLHATSRPEVFGTFVPCGRSAGVTASPTLWRKLAPARRCLGCSASVFSVYAFGTARRAMAAFKSAREARSK